MTLTITRGFTYNAGDQVTDVNLGTLITGASLNSIERGNVDQTNATVISMRENPTPGLKTLEVWQHDQTLWLITKTSSGDVASVYPFGQIVEATEDVDAGHVCAVTGLNDASQMKVKRANADDDVANIVGISMQDISSGSKGVLSNQGPVRMQHDNTATDGGFGLKVSTTDGIATRVASSRQNGFGHQTFAIAIGESGAGWIWGLLRR